MTTETRNPYVGPRTFEREDAPYFFGREREAQDLLFLVLSQRLVLFYAQSGAGKSSLLNTRLRPGLEAEGFRVLPTGRVSGQLPKGIQAQAVSNIFAFNLLLALDGGRVPAAQLQRTTLLDYLRQYQPTPDDKTPTVLLIDQFEEILTTHQDRWMEREGFFQQLQTAMAQDSRLWVVLTLREDYVAALDPYARQLPGRLRSRYYMQRMNAAAALEAIANPAQKEGRPFRPGVGQQLVDNLRQLGNEQAEGREPGFSARSGFLAGLGEFVEPLQLQVVCQRLWANLDNRPGNTITAEDLSELGDVNTALADFYEQTLRQTTLETGVDEYVLRPWVDEELITEGGTRGTVARGQNSTGGLPNDALDSLTRQFLLRQEPRAGGIWYELIHDRFLEPIQQSNQRWRAAQGALYQTALNWKRTGRPREKLYQGNLLWESLSQKNWDSLPLVVQEFLTASLDVQSQTDLTDFYEQALHQTSLEAGVDEYVLRPWIDEKLITVEGARGLVARGQTNTEGLPNAAVDSLMRQFLLRQEPRAGVFWCELIHDRFVEPIRQANWRWREAQSLLSGPLHQTALQWDRSGRSEKLLYQGDLLYESLRQGNPGDATPVVQAFLRASQEAQARRDEEREREARTNRRLRWLTVALVGAVLVAAVLAVLALGESNEATQLSQQIRAIQLAAQAELALNDDPELGLMLAVAAVNSYQDKQGHPLPEAQRSLYLALTSPYQGTLYGHTASVNSASFSPDGARVVTVSDDGTARIWDAATGTELAVLAGHTDRVYSASFSPDGARVVTASDDGTARLWDVETGTELAVLMGHIDGVNSTSFSPDGARVVTASWDRTARLWDAATGTALVMLAGHTSGVTSASFSPDGARVVTASADGTARLWDGVTGTELAVLTGHTGSVRSASFSPDGARVVTASWDGTARLWDAETGTARAVLTGHTDTVWFASFSPDGTRVMTASADRTARLWDVETGTELAVLAGHTDTVWFASFSPDGTWVVTASADRTARLWDVETGTELAVLTGHTDWVFSASFSPDGERVVTASADGTARLWDAPTGTELAVLTGHTDWVNSPSFSPDGARVVTVSNDGTARLWDVETGTELAVLGHTSGVNSASFSPDGARVVTVSDDGTARIWDAATGTELAVLTGHTRGVYSASFSPDGARVVTASDDGTARLWDVETGTELAVLMGHIDGVNSTSFSPDGARVVTASWDRTARLWDAATGTARAVLTGHTDSVNSASFSPDGARVVTASDDGTARIWDVETGTELVMLTGHTAWVTSASFSPDGARVVTASWDGTARLWDAETGTALAVLTGHTAWVWFASFSPDGTWVVTASDDRTARLWDVETGTELAVLTGHTGRVNSASFSPDGARVVTASTDGTARIWRVLPYASLEAMMAEVARRLSRGFTEEECQFYFRDDLSACPQEAP